MSRLENLLFSNIDKVIRIKPETTKALARLKITNIRDLLFHIPSSYNEVKIFPKQSEVRDGDRIIVEGNVDDIEKPKRPRSPTKIYLSTSCGPLTLIFFNKIPVFIWNKVRIGAKITVDGNIELNDYYYQMKHPEFIFDVKISKEIEPSYPLTYALNNRQLGNYIKKAFSLFSQVDINSDPYFKEIFSSLKNMHFLSNFDEVRELEKYRQILSRYELLANQINLARIREGIKKNPGRSFEVAKEKQQDVLSRLGFTPTDAQRLAIDEIQKDQTAPIRMVRMLQGDVGSGKTLVALLTMINVAETNKQCVLMAPTELLATQHYNFFSKALGESSKIALLTSKTKNKKEILSRLESGEILYLIGTHAIFQEKVTFKDLAYIVIDEQHKFGVQQRLDLINKANIPDLLVMTATPIPRSLTLTMFGDMACSKLTGKPKGRLPIITNSVPKSRLEETMHSLQRKLDIGEKVYWICPLIDKDEENEDNEHLIDVIKRAKALNEIYPGMVGIVHGKMKNEDKDRIMHSFKDGDLKILVATTVIEVGIDVPDATLIIIENAEKFGLSSLHQLRGRVGRSSLQSHAILLFAHTRFSNIAKERLKIMRESEDGFYIAEQDLILRGGGEILGTKQSGLQDFCFADIARDIEILVESNKKASEYLESENIQKYPLFLRLFQKNSSSDKILE